MVMGEGYAREAKKFATSHCEQMLRKQRHVKISIRRWWEKGRGESLQESGEEELSGIQIAEARAQKRRAQG